MAWDYDALHKAPHSYFDAVDAQDVEAIVAHFADDATLTIQTANITHEMRNVVVEVGKGKVATEQGYIGELLDGTKNDMHNCNFFDFNEDGKFQRVIIWMAGTSPLV